MTVLKRTNMSRRIKRLLLITAGTLFVGMVAFEIFVAIPVAHQAWLIGWYPTFQENLDAARRDPHDAAAQRGIAWHYQLQQNLPKAEYYWRQAVRLQPENRGSLLSLAFILEREKKVSEALLFFQQLAAKNQTDTDGKAALVMIWYLSQNDLPKAEHHWHQTVRLEPENREALYSLALILRRERKAGEALQVCQHLAAKDKTDIYGQYAMIMIPELSQEKQNHPAKKRNNKWRYM